MELKNKSLYMAAKATPVTPDDETMNQELIVSLNVQWGTHEGFLPTAYEPLNRLIKALGIKVVYGDTATPFTDTNPFSGKWGELHFPYPQAFKSPEMYAYVMMHELSHYAGQWDVERKARNDKGWTILDSLGIMSDDHAVEEIAAETTAMMLAEQFGINIHDTSLDYLAGYVSHLNYPERSWNLSQERAERAFNKLMEFLAASYGRKQYESES